MSVDSEAPSFFERVRLSIQSLIKKYNDHQQSLVIAQVQKRLDAAVAKEAAIEELFERQKLHVEELLKKRFPSDEMLTSEEVCEWLQISPRSLTQYVSEKSIPFLRIGKHLRFPQKALQDWAAKGKPEYRLI